MPKWTLTKTVSFDAAHKLPCHQGKCSNLHGHTWQVTAVLEGDSLDPDGPSAGMVMDFSDVARALKTLTDTLLDHKYLNEVPGLSNPTAERIAQWMFDRLERQLPALVAILVQESPGSSVEYRPRP